MLKNDYLRPSDITGKQNYMNANGDITEGTVINLRKVNFGGLELTNIKASVVKKQSAPLLLGQSVLSRLGRIEIDNASKVLKITSPTSSCLLQVILEYFKYHTLAIPNDQQMVFCMYKNDCNFVPENMILKFCKCSVKPFCPSKDL